MNIRDYKSISFKAERYGQFEERGTGIYYEIGDHETRLSFTLDDGSSIDIDMPSDDALELLTEMLRGQQFMRDR
jgi:hypothetical protein